MTQIINAATTAAGTSAVFAQTADSALQVSVDATNDVKIRVEAQVDAAAPWVWVDSINPKDQQLFTVPKLGNVRLVWAGSNGTPISAWMV